MLFQAVYPMELNSSTPCSEAMHSRWGGLNKNMPLFQRWWDFSSCSGGVCVQKEELELRGHAHFVSVLVV